MKAPLFLTAGFRFFFLAAGLFAVVSVAAWETWLVLHAAGAAISRPTIAMAPHLWHGHEMIYGYGTAVIAGFFLTAVPSWTGEPAARALFVTAAGALWLAGRFAVWFSADLPPFLVAAIDLALLPALSWRIALNLWRRPKQQNVALLGLLALIVSGNVLVHLEWTGATDDTAERGLWLGLLAISALIAVIGGRVTPAFTRNVIARRNPAAPVPVQRPLADKAGILAAVLLGPLVALDLSEPALGAVAAIAAIANGARLIGWRSGAARGDALLLALHLGFAMLVLGYALLALSWLFNVLHPVAAMHGLAIGAVGCMTLAMMTRAPLGHTGRPLRVGRIVATSYALVALAALVRVCLPEVAPSQYWLAMGLSGALWIAAFSIFLVFYFPVLAGPDAERPAA